MSYSLTIPVLSYGAVSVRIIKVSDARKLHELLKTNRAWLERWEASLPGYYTQAPTLKQLRSSIRALRKGAHKRTGAPFVMLYQGEVVGQLSVSDIAWGAIQSGQIGYWIAEGNSGKNITPTAVALVTDHMLKKGGLHRIEICLRPENNASRRVVEKLRFRYEGRRERYIFIDGDWRDHDCYAVTSEEIGAGVLERLKQGILR